MEVGDIIKDNDPRMNGRRLRVVGVGPVTAGGLRHVHCRGVHGHGPEVRIRVDRIHTDGKPRRSGFDLLPRAAAEIGKALAGADAGR